MLVSHLCNLLLYLHYQTSLKMKYLNSLTLFILTSVISFGQGLVKIGDKAPKYYFNKIVNAPVTELDISGLNNKPTILAFWGTWCAPCIHEMINLGKLQKKFGNKVQIVGVSNDSEQKLKTFLIKRPSKIWFASDPSNNLWNIFDLQTAGHAVLIDKNNNIVSVTETKQIDSSAITNLIIGNQSNLVEDRGTKRLSENDDLVKLDSTIFYSFVLQPELKGITPMMKHSLTGPFAKRRITIINLVPAVILREAYDISLSEKVIYPTKEDSIKSNQNSFCVDFIIPEKDKADLQTIFKNELNKHLPVRAEIQKKIISCYVLQPIKDKQILIKQSTKSGNEFSYDALNFEGEGTLIHPFINYLENELSYPVYDATGLTKHYDINFSKNNIEPLKSTKESLAKSGLELVKGRKEMDVLIITAK